MSSNLTDLLKEANLSQAYDIFIPSLNTTLKFKPLVIEQYRNFIDSVTQDPYFNLGFQKELTDIIKNNIIVTDGFNINNLNEIDKIAIALYIRINDISATYKAVDISFKKDEIKKIVKQEPLVITSESITLTCQVPNLITEERYNNFIINRLKENVELKTALKDILNIIFVAEVSKYILNLTLNDVTYTQEESFEQWVSIISTLPTNVLVKIVQYMDNTKVIRDNMLRINDTLSFDYDLNLLIAA